MLLWQSTVPPSTKMLAPWQHDDVIKWKNFPRYCPFVRGIHRSPVNSPHKGQWRRALMISLICVWINGRVNNGEAGDLRRHRAHYGVIVKRRGTHPTSNGSWRQGIKGEMTCTVYVALVWNIIYWIIMIIIIITIIIIIIIIMITIMIIIIILWW